MKIEWGKVAGFATAGLLVAAPAWAQTSGSAGTSGTGSTGSSTSSGTSKSGDRLGGSSSTSPSTSGSTSSDSSKSGSAGSMGSTGSTGSSSTGSSASSSPSASSSASAMGNELTGKVQKFDKAKHEITLALKVSDSTQVTKDGQTATLSDIKEGDQVRASFSGDDVTKIEVMSKSSSHGSGSSSSMGTSGSSSSPSSSGSTGSSSSPSSSGSQTGKKGY
jgi:Cu/Ag efflux protein CusF